MSKPRPIHTIHREIDDQPDESEPSFSYERQSYLASQEEDMEDEFHRRLQSNTAGNSRRSETLMENGSLARNHSDGFTTASTNSGGGGGGSFWRSRGTTFKGLLRSSSRQSQQRANRERPKDHVSKGGGSVRRGSLGGGIGAALLLQPNGTHAAPQVLQESKSEELQEIPRPSSNDKLTASMRRSGSAISEKANKIHDSKKKDVAKQRAEARRFKLESQMAEMDVGHDVVGELQEPDNDCDTNDDIHVPLASERNHNYVDTAGVPEIITQPLSSHKTRNISIGTNDTGTSGGVSSQTFSDGNSITSDLDSSAPEGNKAGGATSHRSSSGGGGGGGGGASSVLFGKSSSLIFPTGVEAPTDVEDESFNLKRHKINALLDACDGVRFPFKKKLILNSLNLTAADIPVKDLYSTSLGNSLHKLSLAGNRLSAIPPKLVTCLPVLKALDLSQCELHNLPERWNLPQLKRLNLSHNRITDFPEEPMLKGLLELQELNMYGNKVSDIIVPQNPRLLSKLEILNLGYNDLSFLPEDLDRLKALRTFRVMHNLLEKVPMRVCDMELKIIDVSSNPVVQPPIETCERGIGSMKRYYHCLRMEDKSKVKLHAAQQSKASSRESRRGTKKTIGFGIPSITKAKRTPGALSDLGSRKTSDDSSSLSFQSIRSQDSLPRPVGDISRTTSAGVPSTVLPSTVKASRTLSDGVVLPESASSRETHLSVSLDQGSTTKKAVGSPKLGSSDFEIPETTGLQDEITVNDTLKVIFVGMEMVGKTSMIKRLIEGEGAVIPKRDDRTIGVDIYEWDPKTDRRYEHIDTRIELGDRELQNLRGDVDVKFSVWDFAGQHVYHATHQLFFSQRALYVIVWDMGATNPATRQRKTDHETKKGAFSLTYDSDDESEEEDDGNFSAEEEARRADRALERDIDEKVQFWVDCIQSSAPGAAILPVASFNDYFESSGEQEAKRRCNLLKERLLRHEDRRIQGIKDRLKEYVDQNRAHDESAQRLRKLLSSYTRPKLIFGNDEANSVLRVSGTKYTGFANLTQRVIDIATGRDKCNMRFPIFRGHVGARIPRMRLEVREAVRHMRDRFKVVEWGYFLTQLRDSDLYSVEDISDALHFLANIGELSYFGSVMPDQEMENNGMQENSYAKRRSSHNSITAIIADDDFLSDDEFENDDDQYLSIDDTTLTSTMANTVDGSMTIAEESLAEGLSQFVFLNPRWLVAAVACILRHDLDREIHETRRSLNPGQRKVNRAESFYEANLNCPVITAEDACMLWEAKKFTKKAAERALEFSSNMTCKPFEFLQLLLIRFGVFVPVDLGIEKAFLGGREYAFSRRPSSENLAGLAAEESDSDLKATYFFLPSLLGPGEPAEAWTYKSTDAWKATLCHSVLFPDGVPPGLMERITATVLSSFYGIAQKGEGPAVAARMGIPPIGEGQLIVKEVLCWRTAFLVKLGLQIRSLQSDGTERVGESIVEVFCGLVDKDSHLCVGSEYMSIGSQRLITSAKGQEGNGGRKIWNGGYLLVVKAVQRVMEEYGGLEYENQGFCPDCLAKKAISEASSWDLTMVRAAVKNGELSIRCKHGHRIDTRLVAGPLEMPAIPKTPATVPEVGPENESAVPINDILRAVVVVALWDGKTRKVIRCGSGFIADRKRGLIVTASHTLMNIWGERSTPFGENYYGLRHGKVLIGVIPRQKDDESGTEAVFRYFAKIVSKDPNIDQGVCHLDACVLRITTRMENDVSVHVEECGEQPERLLLNNPHALRQERLPHLKITDRCELDEQVRIMGYNQGGEGVFGPGVALNRDVDFARGYVCKKFGGGEGSEGLRHRFKPRREIVVICPTIGGHSGGPCVNQQGEVIGILSRADPAESQRCYLVPTNEWKALLKEAKNTL